MADYQEIAQQYCEDVLSGKIPSCKTVKQAVERQLKDLKKKFGKGFPYIYDQSKGARVCGFVELLPHIKGPLAGKPILLEPWQIFIIMTVYSWVK